MKKLIAALMSCLLCFFVAGCSQAEDGAGKTYTDDEFLSELGAGLESRWELNNDYYLEGKYNRNAEDLTALIDAELDHVRKFEKATLSDEKLTTLAHDYISALLNERTVAEKYNTDDATSIAEYSDARAECVRILSLIIKDYKIPVQEQYEIDLQDILEEGSEYQQIKDVEAALDEIASKATVDFKETELGLVGVASFVNTTEYAFAYVDFEIHLYDENDQEIDYYYATLRDWAPGAIGTEELNFYIDEMPARVEVICESFDVARSMNVDPSVGLDETIDEDMTLSPEDAATPYVTNQGLIDPTTGQPVA